MLYNELIINFGEYVNVIILFTSKEFGLIKNWFFNICQYGFILARRVTSNIFNLTPLLKINNKNVNSDSYENMLGSFLFLINSVIIPQIKASFY